jgi:CRP-like cAMP-binding protein
MARADEKIKHLAAVRLFGACTKKELEQVGRAAEELKIPAGKVLCEEGAVGHEFFLILEGEAVVKRKGRKVATLGSGGYFGELALLDRAPRNASVVAETPMEVLVIGQREFSALLDEVPTIAHKLLTSMAHRLREADAKTVH